MTRIPMNLDDVQKLLNDYLLEERPLNLVEMQNMKGVIDCVAMQSKAICGWVTRNRPKMDGLVQIHYENLKRNLGPFV